MALVLLPFSIHLKLIFNVTLLWTKTKAAIRGQFISGADNDPKMAIYKYAQYLTKSDDAKFDQVHTPGSPTPHSGIYRCMVCGREVVSETSKPLPPQNHHQHDPGMGLTRWQLVVW